MFLFMHMQVTEKHRPYIYKVAEKHLCLCVVFGCICIGNEVITARLDIDFVSFLCVCVLY